MKFLAIPVLLLAIPAYAQDSDSVSHTNPGYTPHAERIQQAISLCNDFGFDSQDGTSEHAKCVQREYNHLDEIQTRQIVIDEMNILRDQVERNLVDPRILKIPDLP